MTVRSLVIGLLVAVAVSSLAYANDQLARLAPLMGNHFPPAVFGLLVLLVAANPLLDRVKRGASLQGKELAVIMAMVLTAC